MINTHGEIPDGTPVEIVRVPEKSSSPRSKRGSKKKAESFLALAGIWKDRPEWKNKSSVKIAAELRQRAMGKRDGRRARR